MGIRLVAMILILSYFFLFHFLPLLFSEKNDKNIVYYKKILKVMILNKSNMYFDFDSMAIAMVW